MSDSVDIVRSAYESLAGGDVDGMLERIDRGLEWTFLDPSRADPAPETCHGRKELAKRVRNGPTPTLQLVELAGFGDRVLVVTRSPGLDGRRARATGDLNFHVVTVRDDRIVALRACRDRDEAFAGATA